MKIYPIHTGYFKLDGGAMFGVVPKALWNKMQPADEYNLCNWAMRCLLVENEGKLILIDNGIGDKQDEKFFKHYYLNGDQNLFKSIRALGFEPKDITDVLLTHLHFDHCGGSVSWNHNRTSFKTNFPNATYWICDAQWDWAVNSHAREKASFLRDNILPIQESGQLKRFKEGTKDLFPNISLDYLYGHTEAMVAVKLHAPQQSFLYLADLIPSNSHLRLPFIMGYDVRPLKTLLEKQRLLKEAYDSNYVCIFEHDPLIEACTLIETEKGIAMFEPVELADF